MHNCKNTYIMESIINVAIKYLQFFIIIYYRKWEILFIFEVLVNLNEFAIKIYY